MPKGKIYPEKIYACHACGNCDKIESHRNDGRMFYYRCCLLQREVPGDFGAFPEDCPLDDVDI